MEFFAKKGWEKLPKTTVDELRNRLGSKNFSKLTELLEFYPKAYEKIFNTNNLKIMYDSELFNIALSGQLSTLGSLILGHSGDRKHAEFFLNTSIVVDPEHSTAHSPLAMLYYLEDKRELAKSEAIKALEVMNQVSDETIDLIHSKTEPTISRQQYRDILQSIVDGTLKKEVIMEE